MFGRKELKAKIHEQETKITLLKDEQSQWRKDTIDIQSLHKHNAELATEINKLKTQVREQIEADLFFTSAKICFKLFNGEHKDKVKSLLERQAERQAMLARQQMAAGSPSYSPYAPTPLSNLLGDSFGRFWSGG